MPRGISAHREGSGYEQNAVAIHGSSEVTIDNGDFRIRGRAEVIACGQVTRIQRLRCRTLYVMHEAVQAIGRLVILIGKVVYVLHVWRTAVRTGVVRRSLQIINDLIARV